ncbi:MAG: hypothetical protein KH230_22380 [Enterocloster asparagiformis]|nr:hypothetical protein [Enterocloster asparagiformis]
MAVGSIVDYLNSRGQDSSYNSRKKLAEQYGISGYAGTAAQNTQLLKTLQSGSTAQQPQAPTGGNNVTITPAGPSEKASPAQEYITGYKYSKYSPSNRVNDYADKLEDLENSKPGDFNSRYDAQIQNIINTIQNRPQFDQNQVYDSDLYKQYREQYIQQGNKAMRDTMGNAAALTGGYGSTYATAAGQQAYDGYLSQLGDKTMDIYDRVYNQYLNEGQELYNQLGMLNNQDGIDYGRYRDTVGDYYNDLNYYSNRYNQEYANDFGEYQTDQDAQRWAEQYAYQKTQDALAQSNWREQFDYQKQQDAAQMALAQQRAARSGGSGGSKKSSALDSYVEKARRLLNGEDGEDTHKYSTQAVVANLVNHANLSQEEALKVVEQAKVSQYLSSPKNIESSVDDKKTDKYYSYAKDYAADHEADETYEYLKRFYNNGTINEREADEIWRRLGFD